MEFCSLHAVFNHPFVPFFRYFLKINARNIKYMAPLNFQKMPQTEPKWQFSDTLLDTLYQRTDVKGTEK